MKEILLNLALIELTKFCLKHNIDCSGSFVNKHPTKFTYALIKEETKQALAYVTFHKTQVPTFVISG